ncbi:transcription elongation factor GreA [Gammaproteobacteria bacterium 45_16_T64]|nr:transcription elongation factor GreA [Gammaproteobacteria bacterium 45_16_T64]
MSRFPMTQEGSDALNDELMHLKKVERPKVVAAIAEAREHGDLKENAEYHAAREQQGFIEGRIMDIEGKLSNAQIIDISKIPCTGKVLFGTTISLYDMDVEEEKTYKIVGEDEADIKAGKISVGSPIARGLIGKMEGDEVQVETPGGTKEYEILSVKHG